MELNEVKALFENLRDDPLFGSAHRIEFIWHGGEPTLLPKDFFLQVKALQLEIFKQTEQIYNGVQTNLYRLSSDKLDMLVGKTFDAVSVSIDILGGERKDAKGRDSFEIVNKNLLRLLKKRRVGIISVLGRQHIGELNKFLKNFRNWGTSGRILPIYRSSFESQNTLNALNSSEMVYVYCQLVDYWLANPTTPRIQPAFRFVSTALRFLANRKRRFKAVELRDKLIIVNTDGNAYYQADAYDARYTIANLFSSSWRERFKSEGYRLTNAESARRVSNTCDRCYLYGFCDGSAIAEATVDERKVLIRESGECAVILPVLQYTINRLREHLSIR